MKKYIFIALLFLLAYEAYPQVRLSSMDTVAYTAITPTDLFWMNVKPSSAYLNRRISWGQLRLAIATYIDDLTLTWDSRQTFGSGATFSANSGVLGGTVTFNDSVDMTSATKVLVNFMERTSAASIIGLVTAPYLFMYSRAFVVINPDDNDSCAISYDDSTLTFSKAVSIPMLNVTDNFSMDSAAAIQSLKLVNNTYAISDVADTVITLTALMSNIQLALPGDVTKGIETINMDGAAIGHIILLYTTDVDDSVLFVDAASDGNLKMAGNLWLRTGDNIAFMYIYDQPAAGWFWMEIWRKDN